MNDFVWAIGLISLCLFALLGVGTCLGAFVYLFVGDRRPEEWDEVETHETDRSVTVEEFSVVAPMVTHLSCEANQPASSVLTKRTIKRSTVKTTMGGGEA